ncbi:tolloid-like protein 2 [Physella acuta]|uniref:tolloid-like protein 2 n=1 Tax=Physella acuta TaxID=109671 RepID=UPI0027DDB8CD|nr:tolloid-like protein 2 [Physella acuta]
MATKTVKSTKWKLTLICLVCVTGISGQSVNTTTTQRTTVKETSTQNRLVMNSTLASTSSHLISSASVTADRFNGTSRGYGWSANTTGPPLSTTINVYNRTTGGTTGAPQYNRTTGGTTGSPQYNRSGETQTSAAATTSSPRGTTMPTTQNSFMGQTTRAATMQTTQNSLTWGTTAPTFNSWLTSTTPRYPSTTRPASGCGGTLHQSYGTIMSPNYPFNYENNQLCQWVIKADHGKIIDLRFKRLALEGIDSTYGCPDYVAIYDGALVDYLPIAKLCGSSDVTNLMIRSSGDSLRVEFYTDFSITAPGFIAVFWEHECEALKYGTDLCNVSCSCDKDNTAFCDHFNGTCFCKQGWIGDDCTIDINECVESPTSVCPSEYSVCRNLPGSFECVCETGITANDTGLCVGKVGCQKNCSHVCGVNASQPEQELCFCPVGSKLLNASDTTCVANSIVATYFLSPKCSNLTHGKNCALSCNCKSNTTASCDNRMGTCYCLPGWTSQNCSVDINECLYTSCGLYSYCTNTPGSYKCSCYSGYILSDAGNCIREGCVKTLNSSTGIIQSPNYPYAYGSNLQCKWTIIVELDHIISLRFSTYNVEGCPYDFVQVFDGKSSNDRLIGKYCNSFSIPNQIVSTSNQMFITFVTDGIVSYNGFSATYTSYGTLKRRNENGTNIDVSTLQLCIDHIKLMDGCHVND